MIFLFHPQAGSSSITLDGDAYKHIIKARRHEVGETLHLRRIDEMPSYFYTVTHITKKEALLVLEKIEQPAPQTVKPLHIGWCMIDPKSIEKVLPSLCEMGVAQITFITAARTQRDFTIDHARMERIMHNAMQQCGRFTPIRLASEVPLQQFLQTHPDALVLDFCDTNLESDAAYETVILGPEGGFTHEEKKQLASFTVRKFPTPLVLRSETAALAIASKLLL